MFEEYQRREKIRMAVIAQGVQRQLDELWARDSADESDGHQPVVTTITKPPRAHTPCATAGAYR